MYNESQLKVASLILKDKVFKYKKTKGTFEEFTFYFTAKGGYSQIFLRKYHDKIIFF